MNHLLCLEDFFVRILLRAVVISAVVTSSSGVVVAVEREPETAAEAAATDNAAQEAKPIGTGVAAIEKAAKDNKYLFALFHKEDNDQLTAMRQELAAAMKEVADRADMVDVDISAATEKDIVDQYDLNYAPMPLLLAIAPNGAVTGGFPGRIQAKRLTDVFVSPGTAACLKGFQDRKLVFLCVKNAKTASGKAAMRGVRAFKRDERFAEGTEIIVVDPADKAEAQLLFDLEIDPKTEEAVTVFFAPPGRCIGQFQGATTLDGLVETLSAAMSGCSSCGPGGCGSCGPDGCGP
jgi:hypothetical protein